jgi:hypothetical protein
MDKQIRLDFIFSYWIFTWYILYLLKIIKYSPKFALYVAMIDNMILLGILIYKKSPIYDITKFLAINIFIKYLPIYTLLDEKIKTRDIIATIILFLIYIVYIYVNNNDIYGIYNKLIKGYSDSEEYKTPASAFYDSIFNKLTDSAKNIK